SIAAALFAETQSRAVITVTTENLLTVKQQLSQAGLPYTLLGYVTDKPNIRLTYKGQTVIEQPLADLRRCWQESSPCRTQSVIKVGMKSAALLVSGHRDNR